MTNNEFETVDAASLDNVTGGAGPAEEAGQQLGQTGGAAFGGWVGSKLGAPTVGSLAGGFLGSQAGKYIGRGIDYVNNNPAVRQAAEQAPQGA
jgi:hypothetical protein